MNPWRIVFVLLVAAVAAQAGAPPIELKERTVSRSWQFVVYSPDPAVRSRVAGFADDLRSDIYGVLGMDAPKGNSNIVISLKPASTAAPDRRPLNFEVSEIEGGTFKIEIDLLIGENPAELDLPKQIVRAVLIEYAYHQKPTAIRAGVAFAEPPWWLVEGMIQVLRKKESGPDADLFKRIIDVNKLPSLAKFLAPRPPMSAGATVESIDKACAMCFVQLLIDQSSGRADLARYIQHLPDARTDEVPALLRDFPSLVNEQNMEKWWTLNLARFSAADRYQGLSPEETDAQLAQLLQFEIPTGKGNDKKTFGIADFDEYLKLPASKAALEASHSGLVALSSQASALYRTVIADYDQALALISHGKTHGVKDRITRANRYRETVLRRNSEIADYLNWYEATQSTTRSDAFDEYLKAANDLATPLKRDDPISQYLDEIEGEL